MTAHHAWHAIRFEGAKGHLVPGFLRDDLLAEMKQRNHDLDSNLPEGYIPLRRVRSWSLDLGGSLIVGEPRVVVRVDNLSVGVLCSQIHEIADSLRHMKERQFASGRSYFKHHGAWHCTILTPRQGRVLVEAVDAVRSTAHAQWLTFFDMWKARNEGN